MGQIGSNKTVDIKLTISIITVNRLNIPIKRQRLSEYIKK